MAYTLKTSGIATQLSCCVAIDQDGTTIKEFVNTTVNSQKTIDSGVTVGSATWKSTSRGYFETIANGSFNFDGVRFGTTKPAFNFATGCGFFIACSGMTDGTSFDAAMICATNFDQVARNQGTEKASWYVSSGHRQDSTTSLPTNGTTKFSVAGNFTSGGSRALFYGLESGSLAADGSSTDTGFGSDTTVLGIGGAASAGAQPGKYHIVCVFSDAMTLTDYQSLHDDWFGTLFDATASNFYNPMTGLGGAAAQPIG